MSLGRGHETKRGTVREMGILRQKGEKVIEYVCKHWRGHGRSYGRGMWERVWEGLLNGEENQQTQNAVKMP